MNVLDNILVTCHMTGCALDRLCNRGQLLQVQRNSINDNIRDRLFLESGENF